MENKILEMLLKMDEKLDRFKEEVKQENEKLRQEMNQKIDDLEQKMDQKMNDLEQKMNHKMEDLAKEILDRQFVFEDEYGKKIDAIFEFVDFHQKNNLKRFDRISDVEKRLEIEEEKSLNHEKRISILEREKV